MNTIYIIVNTSRYPYHRHLLSILANSIFLDETDISIIDMCKGEPSSIGQHLSSINIDLLISLDLAGFEIGTFTGECFFNILPCKICNIIWGNKQEYHNYLMGKLSLSMLFYDATGVNHNLSSIYPYLRYYYPTIAPISHSKSSILGNDNTTTQILNTIWSHFLREALL